MNDPRTVWLTIANVTLALAVLLILLAIVSGTVRDHWERLKRRQAMMRGMDQELRQLLRDCRRR